MTLYIHGVGHFHPPNIISNAFLESLNIDTNDAWIMERVGISKRHTVLSLEYIQQTYNNPPRSQGEHIAFSNAEMSLPAINMALERARLKPEQIGMIIAGSCSPQYSLPADACVIAQKMNLTIPALDINSACTTFITHLYMMNTMQAESMPDYVLLVISDNTTRHINYQDRSTCVLWGDAAVALVVSKKIPSKMVVDHVIIESDPSGWEKIVLPAGGHFAQDGRAVQKFAIVKMIKMIKAMAEKAALQPDQYYFIGHQANLRMLQLVCEKMKISPEKHLYNISEYGNCGAAGAPSVLSENYDNLKSGDKVVMALVGAGLSWGSALVKML